VPTCATTLADSQAAQWQVHIVCYDKDFRRVLRLIIPGGSRYGTTAIIHEREGLEQEQPLLPTGRLSYLSVVFLTRERRTESLRQAVQDAKTDIVSGVPVALTGITQSDNYSQAPRPSNASLAAHLVPFSLWQWSAGNTV